MIKIKTNDLIGLGTLICFFLWQIFAASAVQYVFLGATVLLAVLYIIYRKSNFYVIWFFALVFQKAMQRVITIGALYQAITYIDEVTEIIAVIFIFTTLLKRKMHLSKNEIIIAVSFLIYFVFCFLSTVVYSYQGAFVSFLDAFVCIKFFVFYFAGKALITTKTLSAEKVYKMLNIPCKHTAVILLLFSIHDLILPPFFPKYDFRYFTESLELCFAHPAYLAIVCITCICVLCINMQFDKSNMKYILMLAAVTLLTFRSKEMAAVVIMLAIYFLFVKYKLKGNAATLLPFGIAALYFASDQFEKYFTVHDYAPLRLKLMQDGIKIANDHFPFGSGFATFGTTVSYEYNSFFYQQLGYYSELYINQQVIADAFWHGVFAEGGWLGTVGFVLCVVFMTVDSLQKIKTQPYSGWCMLSIMIYGFISSIASSSFFNPAIAVMFIIYGMASAYTETVPEEDNVYKPRIRIHFKKGYSK